MKDLFTAEDPEVRRGKTGTKTKQSSASFASSAVKKLFEWLRKFHYEHKT